jgi:hypothetical protein
VYYSICLGPPSGGPTEPITLRDKLACVWSKYSVITWSRWTFAQLSHRARVKIPQVHRILTVWKQFLAPPS